MDLLTITHGRSCELTQLAPVVLVLVLVSAAAAAAVFESGRCRGHMREIHQLFLPPRVAEMFSTRPLSAWAVEFVDRDRRHCDPWSLDPYAI